MTIGPTQQCINAISTAIQNNDREFVRKSVTPERINQPILYEECFGKCLTPLEYATCYNAIEAGKELIALKAKINQVNQVGETPLHLSIRNAAYFGSSQFSELLLANGADVNKKEKYAQSPPALALIERNFEIFNMLFKKGASLLTRSGPKQETLLMTSLRVDEINIMRSLLDKGLHPKTTNAKGMSSLMIAAQLGRVKMIPILIQYGADPNQVNVLDKNKRAMDYATEAAKKLLLGCNDGK
jgi:ankyrin repeat protein